MGNIEKHIKNNNENNAEMRKCPRCNGQGLIDGTVTELKNPDREICPLCDGKKVILKK